MLLFNKKLKEKGLIDIKDAAVFALKRQNSMQIKSISH